MGSGRFHARAVLGVAAVLILASACATPKLVVLRDMDGRKREEGALTNDGKRHGRWVRWHANGRKRSEGEYIAGRRHGRWVEWRYDGARFAEGRYVDGRRQGKWIFHGPDGSLRPVEYVDGRAVGIDCPRGGEEPVHLGEGRDGAVGGGDQKRPDKEIIRRVIRAHIHEVLWCYESLLIRQPNLGGRVVVRFTIDLNGSVCQSHVAVDDLQPKTPAVGRCIAERIGDWIFPAPEGGGHVIINYPFLLKAEK